MSGYRSYVVKSSYKYWDPSQKFTQADTSLEQEVEVSRRFSDFESLHSQLQKNYLSCIIPPLSEKSLMDKIVADDS